MRNLRELYERNRQWMLLSMGLMFIALASGDSVPINSGSVLITVESIEWSIEEPDSFPRTRIQLLPRGTLSNLECATMLGDFLGINDNAMKPPPTMRRNVVIHQVNTEALTQEDPYAVNAGTISIFLGISGFTIAGHAASFSGLPDEVRQDVRSKPPRVYRTGSGYFSVIELFNSFDVPHSYLIASRTGTPMYPDKKSSNFKDYLRDSSIFWDSPYAHDPRALFELTCKLGAPWRLYDVRSTTIHRR